MKSVRILKKAICIALILTTLLAVSSTAFAGKKSYYVNVHHLYIRSGPSTAYGIIDTLTRGTVVTRISSENNWYYVKYKGGSGYVYSGYVTSAGSSSSKKVSGGTYKPVCNLYIHSQASLDSAYIGKLKKGVKVTFIRQSGSWSYISYKGKRGWVSSKYLKRV